MNELKFDDFVQSDDDDIPFTLSFPTSSLESFTKTETVSVLGQLSLLDAKDLRKYFHGFKRIYNELLGKKEVLEIEEIIYVEDLKEMRDGLHDIQLSLTSIQKNVEIEQANIKASMESLICEVDVRAPEVGDKIKNILAMQRSVAYLKFVKNFLELRDDVRRLLRARRYDEMMKRYDKLMSIPNNAADFTRKAQMEYKIRIESLNQFLLAELRASLLEHYSKLRFPFENAIDYANKDIIHQLTLSVQILKCIDAINESNEKGNLVLEIVLSEFGKRFSFHFYGDRDTNRSSNPEWFFTQVLEWLDKNQLYFKIYVQKFLDDYKQNAMDEFMKFLINLIANKIKTLIADDAFVQNRRLLSHLIDETVIFEKELQDVYNYSEEMPTHAIDELCSKNVLDTWFQLEHDAISVAIDEMLMSADAYDSRYRGATDVDPYLVPNFADSFVLLMQSMFERYSAIPNDRLQCRFVVLQVLIIDEFQSRIAQISQQVDTPWRTPNPQLMNALWYLRVVLDDWSSMPEFVRLQFYLQTSSNSLVRGVFDESSGLYRHFWRQRALNLTNFFSECISEKLRFYSQEKWYLCDILKPVDITQSLSPFLTEVKLLLDWINENISPDSILSIYYLTNHEIWNVFDNMILSHTSFNYRGANQMLYDITKALVPLLNSLFSASKSVGIFDVIMNEKCIRVLNSLRALALPTPSVILLKDELDEISQQTLNERLEAFSITSLDRELLLQLFAQRCDANII